MFRGILEFTNARITKDEALLLSRYASQAKGAIVEIGTLQGGTTELLAEYTPEKCSIWTIDIFQREDCADPVELYRKLYKYKSVFIVIADSHTIGYCWNKPVWLLFIDGNHYKVKEDCDAWCKWIVPGGYIIFHDVYGDRKTTLDGATAGGIDEVRRDVIALLKSDNWETVESVDTMLVLRRREL